MRTEQVRVNLGCDLSLIEDGALPDALTGLGTILCFCTGVGRGGEGSASVDDQDQGRGQWVRPWMLQKERS